jgi:hypothetical protein
MIMIADGKVLWSVFTRNTLVQCFRVVSRRLRFSAGEVDTGVDIASDDELLLTKSEFLIGIQPGEVCGGDSWMNATRAILSQFSHTFFTG